jgi:endonuclease-3
MTTQQFLKISWCCITKQNKFWWTVSIYKSISYPNNKTKYLIGWPKWWWKNWWKNSNDHWWLIQLPGVGRKTQMLLHQWLINNLTWQWIHVFRVSKRIVLFPTTKTPFAVEKDWWKISKELIHKAHHWLILHGRIYALQEIQMWTMWCKTACRYFTTIISPALR